MRTPAEHAALVHARHQVMVLLAGTDSSKLYGYNVEDVIGALRVLLADAGVRGDVLVALGLEGT
jgi:hypothetical protein